MDISLTFDQILLYQFSLFVMLSPLGVIGPFTAMTGDYSRPIQKKSAFRVSLYCGLTLIFLAWVGEWLLRALGISLDSLNAAGGLILMLTSLPLVLKGTSSRRKVDPDDNVIDEESWTDNVVTPLVFPLTVGAGTISLVITMAGQMHTVMDRVILTGILSLHGFIIWLLYFFSGPLSRRIGPQGKMVMNRVGGIVLLSLAFSILTNGLKALLPGLGGV